MSKLAQGTHVYFIDPANNSVVRLTCVTNFNPGGAPADQLDDTCLEDTTKRFKRGLRTPGQATLALNVDPAEASHVRLHALEQDDTVTSMKFAIGWSDGTDAPTADSNGDWVLPSTRTWNDFDGYVSDFPVDFATNAIVKSDVTIQRSGVMNWTQKA